MPSWTYLTFQDRSSSYIAELSFLHDHIITIIVLIIILISYIIICIILNYAYYKFLSEGIFIETIWSIIPALLLVVLVVPSIRVLYYLEDVKHPLHTFKIVAHQWYWTYIVPLFFNLYFKVGGDRVSYIEYDSIVKDESSGFGLRLLEATSDLVIPVNSTSRLLITSTDVIHSFAVPSLGLKVDAIPGRVNQLYSNPTRVGFYSGQCSEICGSNHAFIPINVRVASLRDFKEYSKSITIDYFCESQEFFSLSNLVLSLS